MVTENKISHLSSMIDNGWFLQMFKSLSTVMNEVEYMINEKKTMSYTNIFYSNEIKKLIESITDKVVEVEILDNLVYSYVRISLNVDFDSINTAKYVHLRNAFKEFKNKININ